MADNTGSKPSTTTDVMKQLVRGWAAGTAGLPGDLEGLARMVVKMGASPGSYIDRNMSDTPALPTSEFYHEWLPGSDWETPEGGLAQELGSTLGGVGANTIVKGLTKGLAKSAARGKLTLPATKGYARGGSVKSTDKEIDRLLAKYPNPRDVRYAPTLQRTGSPLREASPELYGFLGGAMGTAPDEFEGYATGGTVTAPAPTWIDIYGNGQRGSTNPALTKAIQDAYGAWITDTANSRTGEDTGTGEYSYLQGIATGPVFLAKALSANGIDPTPYTNVDLGLLNSVMSYNGVNDPMKAMNMISQAGPGWQDSAGYRDAIANAVANDLSPADAQKYKTDYLSSHSAGTNAINNAIKGGLVVMGGMAGAGMAGYGPAASGIGSAAGGSSLVGAGDLALAPMPQVTAASLGFNASGLAGALGMKAGVGATALNSGALNAGMTALRGGNIGQVLKSGVQGAVLSPIASYGSEMVGGGSMGSVFGNSLQGGASSLLSGRDAFSGFRDGAVNGLASAAGNWAGAEAKDFTGSDFAGKAANSLTQTALKGKDIGSTLDQLATQYASGQLTDLSGMDPKMAAIVVNLARNKKGAATGIATGALTQAAQRAVGSAKLSDLAVGS